MDNETPQQNNPQPDSQAPVNVQPPSVANRGERVIQPLSNDIKPDPPTPSQAPNQTTPDPTQTPPLQATDTTYTQPIRPDTSSIYPEAQDNHQPQNGVRADEKLKLTPPLYRQDKWLFILLIISIFATVWGLYQSIHYPSSESLAYTLSTNILQIAFVYYLLVSRSKKILSILIKIFLAAVIFNGLAQLLLYKNKALLLFYLVFAIFLFWVIRTIKDLDDSEKVDFNSANLQGISANSAAIKAAPAVNKRIFFSNFIVAIVVVVIAVAISVPIYITRSNNTGYNTSKWISYSNSNIGFSVKFPFRPTIQTRGNPPTTELLTKTTDSKYGYVVSYYPYPSGSSPQTLIDNYITEVENDNSATISNRNDYQSNGNSYSTENVSFTDKEGHQIYDNQEIIVTNSYLYTLLAESKGTGSPAPNQSYFIKSFQLQ